MKKQNKLNIKNEYKKPEIIKLGGLKTSTLGSNSCDTDHAGITNAKDNKCK